VRVFRCRRAVILLLAVAPYPRLGFCCFRPQFDREFSTENMTPSTGGHPVDGRRPPRALRVVVLLLMLTVPAAFASATADDPPPPVDEDGGDRRVCVTDGCVASAAAVLANMDKTVDPCDDFYEFACGKFVRDAKVDDDKSSRTTYSAVHDMLADKVRRLLEDPDPPPAEPRHSALARRLYGMCMDQRRMEDRGLRPVHDVIAAVGGWPVLEGDAWNCTGYRWTDAVYRFRDLGLSSDYLVDLSVKVDHTDTSRHVVDVDRASLALNPIYLKRGLSDKTVDSYYRYMVDVAVMLGATRDRAEVDLRKSLEFEVLLAKISTVR